MTNAVQEALQFSTSNIDEVSCDREVSEINRKGTEMRKSKIPSQLKSTEGKQTGEPSSATRISESPAAKMQNALTPMCENCKELQQEYSCHKRQMELNLSIMKEKIVTTDGDSFAENAKLTKTVTDLNEKLKKCYGETAAMRIQLEKARQANEPLKKTARRFEVEKILAGEQIGDLTEKLRIAESKLSEMVSNTAFNDSKSSSLSKNIDQLTKDNDTLKEKLQKVQDDRDRLKSELKNSKAVARKSEQLAKKSERKCDKLNQTLNLQKEKYQNLKTVRKEESPKQKTRRSKRITKKHKTPQPQGCLMRQESLEDALPLTDTLDVQLDRIVDKSSDEETDTELANFLQKYAKDSLSNVLSLSPPLSPIPPSPALPADHAEATKELDDTQDFDDANECQDEDHGWGDISDDSLDSIEDERVKIQDSNIGPTGLEQPIEFVNILPEAFHEKVQGVKDEFSRSVWLDDPGKDCGLSMTRSRSLGDLVSSLKQSSVFERKVCSEDEACIRKQMTRKGEKLELGECKVRRKRSQDDDTRVGGDVKIKKLCGKNREEKRLVFEEINKRDDVMKTDELTQYMPEKGLDELESTSKDMNRGNLQTKTEQEAGNDYNCVAIEAVVSVTAKEVDIVKRADCFKRDGFEIGSEFVDAVKSLCSEENLEKIHGSTRDCIAVSEECKKDEICEDSLVFTNAGTKMPKRLKEEIESKVICRGSLDSGSDFVNEIIATKSANSTETSSKTIEEEPKNMNDSVGDDNKGDDPLYCSKVSKETSEKIEAGSRVRKSQGEHGCDVSSEIRDNKGIDSSNVEESEQGKWPDSLKRNINTVTNNAAFCELSTKDSGLENLSQRDPGPVGPKYLQPVVVKKGVMEKIGKETTIPLIKQVKNIRKGNAGRRNRLRNSLSRNVNKQTPVLSLDGGGGGSLDNGASLETGAALEVGALLENGPALEVGASLDNGASLEIGAASEVGASFDNCATEEVSATLHHPTCDYSADAEMAAKDICHVANLSLDITEPKQATKTAAQEDNNSHLSSIADSLVSEIHVKTGLTIAAKNGEEDARVLSNSSMNATASMDDGKASAHSGINATLGINAGMAEKCSEAKALGFNGQQSDTVKAVLLEESGHDAGATCSLEVQTGLDTGLVDKINNITAASDERRAMICQGDKMHDRSCASEQSDHEACGELTIVIGEENDTGHVYQTVDGKNNASLARDNDQHASKDCAGIMASSPPIHLGRSLGFSMSIKQENVYSNRGDESMKLDRQESNEANADEDQRSTEVELSKTITDLEQGAIEKVHYEEVLTNASSDAENLCRSEIPSQDVRPASICSVARLQRPSREMLLDFFHSTASLTVSPLPPSPPRQRVTPLLSPLPVTPQPEALSPLCSSPEILSPPTLRDAPSDCLNSENLVTAKPVAIRASNSIRALDFGSSKLKDGSKRVGRRRKSVDALTCVSTDATDATDATTMQSSSSVRTVQPGNNFDCAATLSSFSKSSVGKKSSKPPTVLNKTRQLKRSLRSSEKTVKLDSAKDASSEDNTRQLSCTAKKRMKLSSDETRKPVSSTKAATRSNAAKTKGNATGASTSGVEATLKASEGSVIDCDKECSVGGGLIKQGKPSYSSPASKENTRDSIIQLFDRSIGQSELEYLRYCFKCLRNDACSPLQLIAKLRIFKNISSSTSVVSAIISHLKSNTEDLLTPMFQSERFSKEKNGSGATSSSSGVDKDCCINLAVVSTQKPMMTEMEGRILLTIVGITKVQHLKAVSKMLTLLIPKAISNDVVMPVNGLLSLCRMFAAVCRLKNDVQPIRGLMYNMTFDSTLSVHLPSVLLSCFLVWPQVFQSTQSQCKRGINRCNIQSNTLSCTIQIIALFIAIRRDDITHVKVLEYMFGWSVTKDSGLSLLVDALLDMLEHPEKVEESSRIAGKQEVAYDFDVLKSIELVSVHMGWEWCNNYLIGERLWGIFRNWCKGLSLQSSSSDGIVADATVVNAIRLIGLVSRIGIRGGYHARSVDSFNTFLMAFAGIIQKSSIHNKISPAVQIASAYTLLDLCPVNPKRVSNVLQNWLRHERTYDIPSDIRQAIQSCVIKQQLE
eukprot:gene17556-19307_t